MSTKIGITKATFDTKVPPGAGITVDVTREAFDNLGKHYVGLVELEVVERTEPVDFEADRKVKLRVVNIELALDDEHADELREQMSDVYKSRTGKDTLFDGGDTEVSVTFNGRTVDTTTGEIARAAEGAAR